MEMGEGEQLERARRRKFWFVLGVMVGAGAVGGFVVGVASGFEGVPIDQALTAVPGPLAVTLLGAALAIFTVGCWAFVRSIDEVELTDNLWGSTIAYYLYAMLFPAWWVLARTGVVAEPNHWLIFFAALGGGCLTYLWRKWRAR